MNEWEHEGKRDYGPSYSVPYPHEAHAGMPLKKKWIAGWLAFFIPGTGHLYLGQMIKGVAIMLMIAFNICAIVFAATQQLPVLFVVLLSLFLPIIYFFSLFDAIQSTDVVNYRWRYSGWQASMFVAPGAPAPAPHAYDQPSSQPHAAYAAAPIFGDQDAAGSNAHSEPYAEHASPGDYADRESAMSGTSPATQPQRGYWPLSRPLNTSSVLLLAAAIVALILIAGIGSSGWIFRSSGSAAGAIVLIAAGVGLWLWEAKGDRSKK